MSRISDTLDQIVFARNYSRELIATIPESEWFRMPAEGVTYVAWQVGHLAMAQFRLTLERIRGPRPDDEQLISPAFLKAFGRLSVADSDPTKSPSVAEIRATFDRVHDRVLAELPTYIDSEMDEPIAVSHRLCKTKIDCLRWCSAHEMIHAGQLGLLRRLFGQSPIW